MLKTRNGAAVLHVLEVEASKNFAAECGAIRLGVSAGFEDVAGAGARLAADAVLHGEEQRLQEGPVVLCFEELVEAADEALDKSGFFFAGLGLGQAEGARVVETALAGVAEGFR